MDVGTEPARYLGIVGACRYPFCVFPYPVDYGHMRCGFR